MSERPPLRDRAAAVGVEIHELRREAARSNDVVTVVPLKEADRALKRAYGRRDDVPGDFYTDLKERRVEQLYAADPSCLRSRPLLPSSLPHRRSLPTALCRPPSSDGGLQHGAALTGTQADYWKQPSIEPPWDRENSLRTAPGVTPRSAASSKAD